MSMKTCLWIVEDYQMLRKKEESVHSLVLLNTTDVKLDFQTAWSTAGKFDKHIFLLWGSSIDMTGIHGDSSTNITKKHVKL